MPRKKNQPAPDPVWADLAKAEGIEPSEIAARAEQHIAKQADENKQKKPKRKWYAHPEDCPDIVEMLDDLSREHEKGYGSAGTSTGHDLALYAEVSVYNAWMKLTCKKQQLREPADIAAWEYEQRYWGNNEGDEP